MDEEQKSNIDPIAEISQRPKQKINVDSFFNRTDDAESITAISLKLASVIEQIDVMRTEIKEIATYITVEHKIEKDLREDRLVAEQDAKQKKEMKDRILAKGEQVPKTAKGETPQEESKGGGGGFLSGLLKVVGGLGLVAGLAALSPIILKVMGVALIGLVATAIAKPLYNWVKGTFDKFKNFLDKTFKPVEKIPVVGKPLKNVLVGGLTLGLPGIAIAAATSISNALKGAAKGNDGGGGGGTSSGPTSGGNMNLEENNAGKDMANTLEEKGVIKDTRNFGDDYKKQEEYFASDEYKQSFDKEVEKVEKVEEVDDKVDDKEDENSNIDQPAASMATRGMGNYPNASMQMMAYGSGPNIDELGRGGEKDISHDEEDIDEKERSDVWVPEDKDGVEKFNKLYKSLEEANDPTPLLTALYKIDHE